MIVTPRILLRLVAIVFAAVLLQVAFFSGVPLLGSVANVVPVVVVALGLLGGAVTGAVSGFAAGILIDVMVGGTLGVSSLALMAAGMMLLFAYLTLLYTRRLQLQAQLEQKQRQQLMEFAR